MRILFAEDDEDLGFGIRLALEKLNYRIDHVRDGMAAEHLLLVQPYDLVILDIGLPKMSGLEVLRRLRQQKSGVAVIVLTARDSIEDKVAGLDAGADDYLVKPFAMDELAARVRALLRRGSGASSVLSHGQLRVDTATRAATVADQPLKLAPREFILLELFVQHVGKLLQKNDLVQRFSDWDNELGSNAIEVSVFRLRKKLEPYGIEIKTIRGAGYLLEADHDHAVD